MNTGDRIRQIRFQKGYSQENMADMLGISTTAYGDIERNKTDLTISRANEIAKILGVNIIELLKEDVPVLKVESQELNSSEKLQLENDKLKAELEKWQVVAAYWKEKYESRFAGNVLKIITEEPERRKIGF
ncbi:helix-turn-helix domain protein [Emticicia oligotrophica DSM 17448]|jgi:transcriptional regulator with XRE-family HTH domain|uniref:Helix-turn-helix domain protein n=1 Tax=Emticicia oligotrophica (strain DSM 17448 / CIP 109782 / MTCC 6937 / GPTSA100-15) TaxID=929562 RepID=A0ABN4APJ0_EMTOG|nr:MULTISPECIES: helix-turn-helix transcriptional regulator [Emticicia]AFK04086.1 helix-turn-helix domain protein [Emticicia oligotrophica DSM 17448]